jgi:hypothetical protein
MEGFNLKKLNDVEVKEQYQVKISNRSAALENLMLLLLLLMMMMKTTTSIWHGKLLDRT